MTDNSKKPLSDFTSANGLIYYDTGRLISSTEFDEAGNLTGMISYRYNSNIETVTHDGSTTQLQRDQNGTVIHYTTSKDNGAREEGQLESRPQSHGSLEFYDEQGDRIPTDKYTPEQLAQTKDWGEKVMGADPAAKDWHITGYDSDGNINMKATIPAETATYDENGIPQSPKFEKSPDNTPEPGM
jgi:hypothetical protein